MGLVFKLKFLIIILYCIWQMKHLYFLEKIKALQPMSFSPRNGKFLFGILYINFLNLNCFCRAREPRSSLSICILGLWPKPRIRVCLKRRSLRQKRLC